MSNNASSRRRFIGGLSLAAPTVTRLSPAMADSYTLRFGLATEPTHPNSIAAVRFASAVNRRAKGAMTIEVYLNGQLANEQGMVDGLNTGLVDLSVVASTGLVPLFQHFEVFDLPFLFKDSATVYRVLDGSIKNDIFAPLEGRGIVALGWGTAGFKEIESANRSIAMPDDMKGMRIRIVGGAINIAMYQALGAIPVTIDLSEAFTALSQRTIDAIDLPLSSFASRKMYTVATHVAMCNHLFSVNPLLMSKRKLDSLPSALQRILKEEGVAIMPYWRSVAAQQSVETVALLKSNGVAFNEVPYAAFRKAVEPVYASVQSKATTVLLEKISRAISGTRA